MRLVSLPYLTAAIVCCVSVPAAAQQVRQWPAADLAAVGVAAFSALQASSHTADRAGDWVLTSKVLINSGDMADGGTAARESAKLLSAASDPFAREDIIGVLAASGQAAAARGVVPADAPPDQKIRDLSIFAIGRAMAGEPKEAIDAESQAYAMLTPQEQSANVSDPLTAGVIANIGVALARYGSPSDAAQLAATFPDLGQAEVFAAIAEVMCDPLSPDPKLFQPALDRLRKLVLIAPGVPDDKRFLTSIADFAGLAIADCGSYQELVTFISELPAAYDRQSLLGLLRLNVMAGNGVVARTIVEALVQPAMAALDAPPPDQARPSKADYLGADVASETKVGLFDLATATIPQLDVGDRAERYSLLLQAEASAHDQLAMVKTAPDALAASKGAASFILFDEAHSLVLGGLEQQAQIAIASWEAAVASNTQLVPPAQDPAALRAVLAADALGPKVVAAEVKAAGPITVPLSGASRLLSAIMASDGAKDETEALSDAQGELARLSSDTSGPGATALDQIMKDYAASGDIADARQLASNLSGDDALAGDQQGP